MNLIHPIWPSSGAMPANDSVPDPAQDPHLHNPTSLSDDHHPHNTTSLSENHRPHNSTSLSDDHHPNNTTSLSDDPPHFYAWPAVSTAHQHYHQSALILLPNAPSLILASSTLPPSPNSYHYPYRPLMGRGPRRTLFCHLRMI